MTRTQISHTLHILRNRRDDGLAALMIWLPLSSAGDPSEPAPPTAMM